MKLEEFVSRLDKVRATGRSSWLACCPAHDDRHPSLTVGVGDNGGVIVHCFGGCEFESIVAAVGMDIGDLMPDGPAPSEPVRKARIPARDVLEAMAFNAMVVAICAADMAKGEQLSTETKDKLFAIAGAFQEAIEYATRR